SFKAPSNSTKEPNLAFGRASGLRVGNTYLVFAKFVSEPDVIYNALVSDRDDDVQSLISKRSKASVLDLIRCKGLAPGPIFMPDFYAPDGAWRVTERGRLSRRHPSATPSTHDPCGPAWRRRLLPAR